MTTSITTGPRAPNEEEIDLYLRSRSGIQMMELMRGISEPAAQAALAAKLLFTPPSVVGINAAPEKAKKALNAFVGFRCYYISIPVFKLWPMKKLSNLLSQLWEMDPNKSLWSLMAKAWSAIRDQIGKDKAPLDQFFQIICPYLDLPSPETYLESQGWKLDTSQEGSPILSRKPTTQPSASISAGFTDMTLSVEDITGICQSMGYAQGYVTDPSSTSPTFLGCSVNHSTEKKTRKQIPTPAVGSVQDARVAARNKRRTKRQIARQSGTVPALREQIFHAHGTSTNSMYSVNESNRAVAESSQFYDELASLLTNHNGQDEIDSLSCLNDDIAAEFVMNTGDSTLFTDWSAFRLGADENVTLPSFDSAVL